MDWLDQVFGLFSDFTNPKKRLFLGYVGLSIFIAIIWLFFFQKNSLRTTFRRIFDPKIIFSGSALADYKVFVINRIFTGFISPLLLTQVGIATAVFMALVRSDLTLWGIYSDAPKAAVVTLFSLAIFLADDLTKYLVHRWMHRWPMLWSIHKIHHSAETMTPMTVYRVHPFEGILYASRNAVAQGTVISIFYYLFGDQVDLITVVGVNVLVFIFHISGSNLRHSHIDIRYPKWVEHIFISPAQHQLHHSIAVQHYDKNYGSALAIWDWFFGSLHLSKDQHDMKFGLLPSEAQSATNLTTIYLGPIREISKRVERIFKRIRRKFPRRVDQTTKPHQ